MPAHPLAESQGQSADFAQPYRPPGQRPGSGVVHAGEWQSVLTHTISAIAPFLQEEQTEEGNTHTTQTSSSKQAKFAHLQDVV